MGLGDIDPPSYPALQRLSCTELLVCINMIDMQPSSQPDPELAVSGDVSPVSVSGVPAVGHGSQVVGPSWLTTFLFGLHWSLANISPVLALGVPAAHPL